MAKAAKIKSGALTLRRKEKNKLTAFKWAGGGVAGLPGWITLQELRFDAKRNVLEIRQRLGALLHVQKGDILVHENNKIHCHTEEVVIENFEIVLEDKPKTAA